MSTQASYFKLGIFVVAATALLCAGVIVLGAGKLLERKILLETHMVQSVEGLGKGSAFKYQGVELGQVTKILIADRKYDPDFMREGRMRSPILVELAIVEDHIPDVTDEEFAAWLEKAAAGGLRARIASSGLTGPAFVELVYLDPEAFPPPELDWPPPPLYIPSAPSTTQVLIGAVQAVLEKLKSLDVEQVLADLDTLLENANDKVAALDVQTLNGDAVTLLENLRAKIDAVDTKRISDEAVGFLEEIRTSNDRLQEILNNPNIDPSLEDLRATLANAKEATARIDEILADPKVKELIGNLAGAGGELTPTLEDLRRAVRRIDRLIAAQQANIESVIDELNRAMANIRALTEDAKQNPARVLFGDPPPRSRTGDDR
jgi:ABC-type transporter Mla subunit MlaD